MSLFDGVREVAFDVVTTVMGTEAAWTPSTGGAEQKADVLFRDPDRSRKLGDIEYLPQKPTMEYRKPFFPDLKLNVDSNEDETVIIKEDHYHVRSVKAISDGNKFIAVLEKV